MNSTTLAIRVASRKNTLAVRQVDGRFGGFWVIEDDCEIIEAHESEAEARARVTEAGG